MSGGLLGAGTDQRCDGSNVGTGVLAGGGRWCPHSASAVLAGSSLRRPGGGFHHLTAALDGRSCWECRSNCAAAVCPACLVPAPWAGAPCNRTAAKRLWDYRPEQGGHMSKIDVKAPRKPCRSLPACSLILPHIQCYVLAWTKGAAAMTRAAPAVTFGAERTTCRRAAMASSTRWCAKIAASRLLHRLTETTCSGSASSRNA
jgi:hypothetical protein